MSSACAVDRLEVKSSRFVEELTFVRLMPFISKVPLNLLRQERSAPLLTAWVFGAKTLALSQSSGDG